MRVATLLSGRVATLEFDFSADGRLTLFDHFVGGEEERHVLPEPLAVRVVR
jgi:hypothetical protein